MFNYKYIVLTDLDGTLLNSKGELSPETIKYVHELNKRDDILFAFNTGRAWHDSKHIYEQLELKGFVSCCNSAMVYNPHTNKSFHSFLSTKMCIELLRSPLIIDQLSSGTVLTDKNTFQFTADNSLSISNSVVENACDVYGLKFFFKDTCENFNEKIQMIKNYKPAPKITIFKYPGLENVELQANHVNKENAVLFFSNYYGVDPNNILTFGDNHNDISVMEGCSRSYAVNNAINQIKQHAKFLSKYTNDQDAVINEVKKFLSSIVND